MISMRAPRWVVPALLMILACAAGACTQGSETADEVARCLDASALTPDERAALDKAIDEVNQAIAARDLAKLKSLLSPAVAAAMSDAALTQVMNDFAARYGDGSNLSEPRIHVLTPGVIDRSEAGTRCRPQGEGLPWVVTGSMVLNAMPAIVVRLAPVEILVPQGDLVDKLTYEFADRDGRWMLEFVGSGVASYKGLGPREFVERAGAAARYGDDLAAHLFHVMAVITAQLTPRVAPPILQEEVALLQASELDPKKLAAVRRWTTSGGDVMIEKISVTFADQRALPTFLYQLDGEALTKEAARRRARELATYLRDEHPLVVDIFDGGLFVAKGEVPVSTAGEAAATGDDASPTPVAAERRVFRAAVMFADLPPKAAPGALEAGGTR